MLQHVTGIKWNWVWKFNHYEHCWSSVILPLKFVSTCSRWMRAIIYWKFDYGLKNLISFLSMLTIIYKISAKKDESAFNTELSSWWNNNHRCGRYRWSNEWKKGVKFREVAMILIKYLLCTLSLCSSYQQFLFHSLVRSHFFFVSLSILVIMKSVENWRWKLEDMNSSTVQHVFKIHMIIFQHKVIYSIALSLPEAPKVRFAHVNFFWTWPRSSCSMW